MRTRQCRLAAIQTLAQRWYGVELCETRIERFWGLEDRAFFREVFAGIDSDTGRLTCRYESLNAEFPIQLHPDARPALESLGQSHLLGVVTAVGRTPLERQLQGLGLSASQFSLLQAAADTPVHKPDPAVFLPALIKLEALGVTPERVTYVGDSLNDGLGALGVRVELGMADRSDSAGSFDWHGLASTYFRVDPAERLVLVALAQHFPFDEHRLFGRVTNMVYSQL